ncbi:olfactory receptor 10A7-like [Gastrophryne carolinensis]
MGLPHLAAGIVSHSQGKSAPALSSSLVNRNIEVWTQILLCIKGANWCCHSFTTGLASVALVPADRWAWPEYAQHPLFCMDAGHTETIPTHQNQDCGSKISSAGAPVRDFDQGTQFLNFYVEPASYCTSNSVTYRVLSSDSTATECGAHPGMFEPAQARFIERTSWGGKTRWSNCQDSFSSRLLMDDNSQNIPTFHVKEDNTTEVKEFILLAFSNLHDFQILLFLIILIAYVISVTGNLAIIILVKTELSLQTPMYSFISTFAILEIMFVTDMIPKLLDNLISKNKKISRIGCFAQMYAFNGLGITECYLLAVMAFDRDLAINNPLHYSSIMDKKLSTGLAVVPWIIGFSISLMTTAFTARLKYCGPNKINHFVCDLAPLQSLACSDPFISKVVTLLAAALATIIPFIIIIAFYIHIINTISKIKSAEGKQKTFSTCSSHLIVASMYYGTASIVYVRPNGSQYDKFLALMYTVLTPLLNPFVYTLRNSNVKNALKHFLRKFLVCDKTNI